MTCILQGCERRSHAKGLCLMHYQKGRRAQRRLTGLCFVPGCGKPLFEVERCKAHYERWRRHRAPLGDSDLIRLRRAVGLPDDGPTQAHRERWAREEARG